MNVRISIPKLGLLYEVSSLIIGPLIVFYALGRGRVGMDCSDGTWSDVSELVKNSYYQDATRIMSVSSLVLLIIGGFLLFGLLKTKGHRQIALAIPVALVMCGYTLIILMANNLEMLTRHSVLVHRRLIAYT